MKYRPFYVQTATERDKATCLCKVCLNFRLKYKALSEYFGSGITCPKDINGYYQRKCIAGECEMDGSTPTKTKYTNEHFDIPKMVYNQFILETYEYTNRKGEKTEGKCTVRKTFHDEFDSFKSKLDSCGASYMNHRFEIKNDIYYWLRISGNSNLGYIFHMDFSENVSCTPKFEPQDAHFSGKETSLHCSVVSKPYMLEKECTYVYHLSDDRTHDFAFTISVTRSSRKIS